MQVQNNHNVSFGGMYRVMVEPRRFKHVGDDIIKSYVKPYAELVSGNIRFFVGGPKFPAYLNEAGLDEVVIKNKKGEETGTKTVVRLLGNAKQYLKKLKGRVEVPKYFSSEETQPLYIITNSKDVNAIDNFMQRSENKNNITRLRYGAFAEFLENTLDFEAQFAKQIEDLTFSDLDTFLKVFNSCSKLKNFN